MPIQAIIKHETLWKLRRAAPSMLLLFLSPLTIHDLINNIAIATTAVSLVTTALAALSWGLSALIRSSPLPWSDWKRYAETLQQDSIRSLLYLAIFSSISALVAWVASV